MLKLHSLTNGQISCVLPGHKTSTVLLYIFPSLIIYDESVLCVVKSANTFNLISRLEYQNRFNTEYKIQTGVKGLFLEHTVLKKKLNFLIIISLRCINCLLFCSFFNDTFSTLDTMAANHLIMLNRTCNERIT